MDTVFFFNSFFLHRYLSSNNIAYLPEGVFLTLEKLETL